MEAGGEAAGGGVAAGGVPNGWLEAAESHPHYGPSRGAAHQRTLRT